MKTREQDSLSSGALETQRAGLFERATILDSQSEHIRYAQLTSESNEFQREKRRWKTRVGSLTSSCFGPRASALVVSFQTHLSERDTGLDGGETKIQTDKHTGMVLYLSYLIKPCI